MQKQLEGTQKYINERADRVAPLSIDARTVL